MGSFFSPLTGKQSPSHLCRFVGGTVSAVFFHGCRSLQFIFPCDTVSQSVSQSERMIVIVLLVGQSVPMSVSQSVCYNHF